VLDKFVTTVTKAFAKFRASLTDNLFVQIGHACGGYGIAVTPLIFGATWTHLGLGLLLVVLWSTPKEYVFDILVEKQTVHDGWIDQRSYFIGAAVAVCVALFALL